MMPKIELNEEAIDMASHESISHLLHKAVQNATGTHKLVFEVHNIMWINKAKIVEKVGWLTFALNFELLLCPSDAEMILLASHN